MSPSGIDVLLEHPRFLVVNKPSGLLSIPDREGAEPSLRDFLTSRHGKVFTVHRLDRETSGIILFARDEAAHKFFSSKFENREIRKWYRGFVHGVPDPRSGPGGPGGPTGSLDGPIMENPSRKGQMMIHRKGKPSRTDYTVLQSFGLISYLEFEIHTGRTHQIRVHSAGMGHPILCDPLYGDGKPILLSSIKLKFKLSRKEGEEHPILRRLALHAWKLAFDTPEGEYLEVEAPLPKDLKALLQQLQKWKGASPGAGG